MNLHMNLYVYYDERYMTNWISDEISLAVTNFLQSRGFSVLNADELAEMMRQSVDEDRCWESLVIFSRDVVPETVCHSSTPSTLIRDYLDCGGTIVWLGDVPFYYRGHGPSSSKRLKEKIKQADQSERGRLLRELREVRDEKDRFALEVKLRGCFNALGVVSVFLEHPASKVRITGAGRELGLSSSWYSVRPILIRGSNLRKKKPAALATIRPRYMMPFERHVLDEKKEKKFSLNIIDLLSKILGLIPAMITMATALYFLLAGSAASLVMTFLGVSAALLSAYVTYWFFWSRATYAGAWFKNFDRKYPHSGFYRLWDFRLHRVTQNTMEELLNIIQNITQTLSQDAT